jgi:hypothetical protein
VTLVERILSIPHQQTKNNTTNTQLDCEYEPRGCFPALNGADRMESPPTLNEQAVVPGQPRFSVGNAAFRRSVDLLIDWSVGLASGGRSVRVVVLPVAQVGITNAHVTEPFPCHMAASVDDTWNTVASGGAARASGRIAMTLATSGNAS